MKAEEVLFLLARGAGDADSALAEHLAFLCSTYKVHGAGIALNDATQRRDNERRAKQHYKFGEWGWYYHEQREAVYGMVVRIITGNTELGEG